MKYFNQPLTKLLLASFVLLTACSSNDDLSLSDDSTPLSGGATPKYLPPYPGGTNNKSYEVLGQRYKVLDTTKGYDEVGIASWYGDKFHGKKTSTGEVYNMHAFTAAHKTLPLPTFVKVTNLESNESLVVKVNDRGPFVKGRIIDLSYAAAKRLGTSGKGLAKVRVQALSPYQYRTVALADAAGAGQGSNKAPARSNADYELAEVLDLGDEEPPVATPVSQPAVNKAQVGLQMEPLSVGPDASVATANNTDDNAVDIAPARPLVQASSSNDPDANKDNTDNPNPQPAGQSLETPVVSAATVAKPQQIVVVDPGASGGQDNLSNTAKRCVPGSKRCLQLGVFSTEQKAQQVQQTLRTVINDRIEIQSAQIQGQQQFRVLVGPLRPSEFNRVAISAEQAGIYGRFVNF